MVQLKCGVFKSLPLYNKIGKATLSESELIDLKQQTNKFFTNQLFEISPKFEDNIIIEQFVLQNQLKFNWFFEINDTKTTRKFENLYTNIKSLQEPEDDKIIHIIICLLYGGSGAGKTTSLRNFLYYLPYSFRYFPEIQKLKGVDLILKGSMCSTEIYYENNQILKLNLSYYYGSPLSNFNITNIEKIYDFYLNFNPIQKIEITIFNNFSKQLIDHFDLIKNDKYKDLKEDFRVTSFKATDNNPQSSRSHVIHFLIIKINNKENEDSYNLKTEVKNNLITYSFINLKNKDEFRNLFNKHFKVIIVVDTMGFENIMTGLDGDQDLFLFFDNINLINEKKFNNTKFKNNKNSYIDKNLENPEKYIKNLALEAAYLIIFLTDFINTSFIDRDKINEDQINNPLFQIINKGTLNLNDENILNLHFVYFSREQEYIDFIFFFYRKLLLLENIAAQKESFYSLLNQYIPITILNELQNKLKFL